MPRTLSASAVTPNALGASAITSLPGTYPASDTYPGATTYPGHGNDLSAAVVSVKTLTAAPNP